MSEDGGVRPSTPSEEGKLRKPRSARGGGMEEGGGGRLLRTAGDEEARAAAKAALVARRHAAKSKKASAHLSDSEATTSPTERRAGIQVQTGADGDRGSIEQELQVDAGSPAPTVRKKRASPKPKEGGAFDLESAPPKPSGAKTKAATIRPRGVASDGNDEVPPLTKKKSGTVIVGMPRTSPSSRKKPEDSKKGDAKKAPARPTKKAKEQSPAAKEKLPEKKKKKGDSSRGEDATGPGRVVVPHAEFHELSQRSESSRTECSDAQRDTNTLRNRYGNALPSNETRVRLRGADHGDYINATLVNGHGGYDYIAAQAPLLSTVDDFWLMIYEQNVRVVVMLTKLVEGEKEKAEMYWPRQGPLMVTRGPSGAAPDRWKDYGAVAVLLLKSFKLNDEVTLRAFRVRQGGLSREEAAVAPVRHVVQIHYLGWPDFGVPADLQDFYSMLQLMELYQSESPETPIVNHAAAGALHLPGDASRRPPTPVPHPLNGPMIVHCVAQGSRIALPSGLDVPIEALKHRCGGPFSQDVCAWGVKAGCASASTWLDQGCQACVRLVLADGRRLAVTEDHRLLVAWLDEGTGLGWESARAVRAGLQMGRKPAVWSAMDLSVADAGQWVRGKSPECSWAARYAPLPSSANPADEPHRSLLLDYAFLTGYAFLAGGLNGLPLQPTEEWHTLWPTLELLLIRLYANHFYSSKNNSISNSNSNSSSSFLSNSSNPGRFVFKGIWPDWFQGWMNEDCGGKEGILPRWASAAPDGDCARELVAGMLTALPMRVDSVRRVSFRLRRADDEGENANGGGLVGERERWMCDWLAERGMAERGPANWLRLSRRGLDRWLRTVGVRHRPKALRLLGRLRLARAMRWPQLAPDRAFWPAPVLCVEDEGFCRVFDLSVPGPQCFVAQGAVVHNCSAGLGRTGTLIAAHMALNLVRENRVQPLHAIDVQSLVLMLRQLRPGMVQTSAQYRMIYAMYELLVSCYFPDRASELLLRLEPPDDDPRSQALLMAKGSKSFGSLLDI